MYFWRLYYELHSTNCNYRDSHVSFCWSPYLKPTTIILVEQMEILATLAIFSAVMGGAFALTPKK